MMSECNEVVSGQAENVIDDVSASISDDVDVNGSGNPFHTKDGNVDGYKPPVTKLVFVGESKLCSDEHSNGLFTYSDKKSFSTITPKNLEDFTQSYDKSFEIHIKKMRLICQIIEFLDKAELILDSMFVLIDQSDLNVSQIVMTICTRKFIYRYDDKRYAISFIKNILKESIQKVKKYKKDRKINVGLLTQILKMEDINVFNLNVVDKSVESLIAELDDMKKLDSLEHELNENDKLIISKLDQLEPIFDSIKGLIFEFLYKTDYRSHKLINDIFSRIFSYFRKFNIKDYKSKIKRIQELKDEHRKRLSEIDDAICRIDNEYLQLVESDVSDEINDKVNELLNKKIKLDEERKGVMSKIKSNDKNMYFILRTIMKLKCYRHCKIKLFGMLDMLIRRIRRTQEFNYLRELTNCKEEVDCGIRILRREVLEEISKRLDGFENEIVAISEMNDNFHNRVKDIYGRFRSRCEMQKSMKNRGKELSNKRKMADNVLEVIQTFKKMKPNEEIQKQIDAKSQEKDELLQDSTNHYKGKRVFNDMINTQNSKDCKELKTMYYEIHIYKNNLRGLHTKNIKNVILLLLSEFRSYYKNEGSRVEKVEQTEFQTIKEMIQKRMRRILEIIEILKKEDMTVEDFGNMTLDRLNYIDSVDRKKHINVLCGTYGREEINFDKKGKLIFKCKKYFCEEYIMVRTDGYEVDRTVKIKNELFQNRVEMNKILGKVGERSINFKTIDKKTDPSLHDLYDYDSMEIDNLNEEIARMKKRIRSEMKLVKKKLKGEMILEIVERFIKTIEKERTTNHITNDQNMKADEELIH